MVPYLLPAHAAYSLLGRGNHKRPSAAPQIDEKIWEMFIIEKVLKHIWTESAGKQVSAAAMGQ